MSRAQFLRDAAVTAIGQYAARAVLLARGVVAMVVLRPAGFGSWNALGLVLDYGGYATAGVLQGLDLRLPPAVARGDAGRARREMAGAWSVVLLGGLLFAVVLGVYLATGARALSRPWGIAAPALLGVAALLTLAIQYLASVLKARGQFRAASLGQSAQVVVGGLLGMALVARFGVWALIGGWLVGTVVAVAIMAAAAPGTPFRPAHFEEGVGLARLGFPVFGYFAASLVLRSVDRLALVRYAAREELGHYAVGLMAAGLVLYLPEAAATVLYPRITAAAEAARDPGRTRAEVRQAHRALTVALPALVGFAVLWAGPLIAAFLPAYREGVPAVRMLALASLLFAAGTLPGYYLLGSGRARLLLGVGWGVAAIAALLVFATAARAPRATPVAVAEACGYALFALAAVTLASRELCAGPVERLRFALASFVPALWAAFLALALGRLGDPFAARDAALRGAAFVLGYLPALWWFGRGLGLKRLAADWLTPRPATA